MQRKVWLLCGFALVPLAGLALRSETRRPARAIEAPRAITLIAPDTNQTTLDMGRPGPSQGDMLVFSGPAMDSAGNRIGRVDGTCVTTSIPETPGARNWRTPEMERRHCAITVTLDNAQGPGSEIAIQGVGRFLAEDVLFAVTGGTLQYQNARGQALVDYTTRKQLTITLNLLP